MELQNPEQLNRTQQLFVAWNAERLDISRAESFRRLRNSWNTVPGGYGGAAFRDFNVTCHDVFQVFYSDGETEVLDAYSYFAPLHLLRMLSYPEPLIKPQNPILRSLPSSSDIVILDFGCGLAQQSRAIAETLQDDGRRVKLVLADIPTLRKEFLLYLCRETAIDAVFLDCTRDCPIPRLPPHHLCIATEFFEHVHDPITYLNAIDQTLIQGGILVTNVADHGREFMHVSPDLSGLREALDGRGYTDIKPLRIFRKERDTLV